MKSEALSPSPLSSIGSFFSGFSGYMSGAMHALQVGQMCSALYRLNDHQLDELGITRQDIPAHARKLMERGN